MKVAKRSLGSSYINFAGWSRLRGFLICHNSTIEVPNEKKIRENKTVLRHLGHVKIKRSFFNW